MFKIESYVTPILLSYVDKYVRDFKPADAQVSLWGGGVALHNLVLKADVLQQEVSLPFTLVSGRIHELLIQVPWTKIMSEPIIVTIDTIECVLNLNPPTSETVLPESPSCKTQVVEAPPGYMQALVRRIVSNIALRVHHLIVKYVQDDIVMSLNIKHLAIDSAGVNWEPAFADIDPNQPVVRRLVRLDDLTLCLDKADADGKIRFYQEPVLYRCQLDLRVLTRLVSANTRRASSLSIQLFTSKLAWSVTSDQLTLLIRLVREKTHAHLNTQPTLTKNTILQNLSQIPSSKSSIAEPTRSNSWSEWAWSWLPSWSDKPTGAEETPMPATPLPLYFSACLDDVSLVFKVMELEGQNRKRSRSVLEVSATFAAIKCTACYPTSLRIRFGARHITVQSHGKCICGFTNYDASLDQPTVYLKRVQPLDESWSWPEDFLTGSSPSSYNVDLAEAVDEEYRASPETVPNSSTESEEEPHTSEETGQEPKVLYEEPNEMWVKLSPAFLVEYIHERSPPDPMSNPYDNPPIDFEYSDWVEDCRIKVKLEPVEVRACMGLVHRLSMLLSIFKELHPLHNAGKVAEQPRRTLTIEECDALTENLPERRFYFESRGLLVHVIPWNHSLAERPLPPPIVLNVNLPKTVMSVNAPLYPHRICAAACQVPQNGGPLWHGAHLHWSMTVTDAQVYISSMDDEHHRPCIRTDLRFVMHRLLNKEYFDTKEPVEMSYTAKIEELSICGSAARLQAACQVPLSLMHEQLSIALKYSSLPKDALNDEEAVAIDFTLEELTMRGYFTKNIKTHAVSMVSAKATAHHEPTPGDLNQAWLFSAPDAPTSTPYLRMAWQWCRETVSNSFDYLGIWTEPMAISIDPLFITWLAYKSVYKTSEYSGYRERSSTQLLFQKRTTTPSSSMGRGSRVGSGAELVHMRPRTSVASSSERSEKKETKPIVQPKLIEKWWQGDNLVALHHRLRNMLINIEMGLVLVYVTMSSASALDCITLRDAMERHANDGHRVLAISLGRIAMHSNSSLKYLWHKIQHDGPTYLEQKPEGESFPWKIRLADVSCYTLEPHEDITSHGTTERRYKASTLRSTLKQQPALARPRIVLDLVTTTITVSVMIKSQQIKNIHIHPPRKHVKEETKTPEQQKTKFFTTGTEFKPSTLQEFFRGPVRRSKRERRESETSETSKSTKSPETETREEVTVKQGPVISLGVHLHADTPPIIIRLERDQVHVVAVAIHCFNHIITLLRRGMITVPKHSMGLLSVGESQRSLIRSVSEELQTHSDDTQSKSSGLIEIFDRSSHDVPKLTTFLWFQWVISHASLVIASNSVKLAFDADDIISTVDVQTHYNQLKIKIASASVRHYERTRSNEWIPGALGGRVLEATENSNAKNEDHFLSVTITQAQLSNLPESWKQELNPKLLHQKTGEDTTWEVFATLAPLEAIIQPVILDNTVTLLKEISPRAYCPLKKESHVRTAPWQWPFCYVSAGGLRVLVTGEQAKNTNDDDTFVFQIGNISVTPHPENPICRRSVNSGPESAWVSGNSNYEGHQYEIYIKQVSLRTGRFQQITQLEARNLQKHSNENPAVKWTEDVPTPKMIPFLNPMDVCCVIAPAIYIGDVLASGPAVELNLVTDCNIEINIEQAVLWQNIILDLQAGLDIERDIPYRKHVDGRDKYGLCPYAGPIKMAKTESLSDIVQANTPEETNRSLAGDSGVDTLESASMYKTRSSVLDQIRRNVSIVLSEPIADASEYLEVFLTMGTVDMTLYVKDNNTPEMEVLKPPQSVHSSLDPEPVPEDIGIANTVPDTQRTRNKVYTQYQVPKVEEKTDEREKTSTSRSITENVRVVDTGMANVQTRLDDPAWKTGGNLPLLHITLQQPNLYYWRKKDKKSIQVSLFNAWVGLGVDQVPGQWHAVLVSTAKGAPDPVTDIPPALLFMKIIAPVSTSVCSTSSSVKGSIRLDVERPLQLEVCEDGLNRLIAIQSLLKSNFNIEDTTDDAANDTPKLYNLRQKFLEDGIENVVVNTNQIGVVGKVGTVGWDSLSFQLAIGSRPDRIASTALVTALVTTIGPPNDRRHVLLQPLILGLKVEACWEAWRRAEGGPGTRDPSLSALVEIDRITIDLRPSDVEAVDNMLETVKNLTHSSTVVVEYEDSSDIVRDRDCRTSTHPPSLYEMGRRVSGISSASDTTSHYYKDDLRSGAFKILTGGQLPMAYQVVMNGNAVSWRYPHPRAITRIVAFPLPGVDKEIQCVLELFTPMLGLWEPHTYFKIPISEPREIFLYVPAPDAVFATMWRFRYCSPEAPDPQPYKFNVKKFTPKNLLFSESYIEDVNLNVEEGVTAEQLSGVLRVDSYFAPRVLARNKLIVRVAETEVFVHNSIPAVSTHATSLDGYYVSRPLMRSHRVLSLNARDTKLHAQLGSCCGVLYVADSKLSSDIMDCATGTMEQMIKEFRVQAAMSAYTWLGQDARARVASTGMHVSLHIPRMRTLNSLLKEWNNAFKQVKQSRASAYEMIFQDESNDEAKTVADTVSVLEGRVSLWIHNNCASALRVGQEGTDELVPLGPGASLAYRWRCPSSPKRIRLALANPTANWHWSSSLPFTAGMTRVKLEDPMSTEQQNARTAGLFVHVMVVDKGSKRSMYLTGRLSLANMLRFNLLFKVRAHCQISGEWRTVCSDEIQAESIGKSVVCSASSDLVLKIKFPSRDAGWSGDIPLKECPKENVPWLVKVPSDGDYSYISVWCRVVRARSDSRILATVWPLYVLYSDLPLDTDVLIVTEKNPNKLGETADPPPLVQSTPGRGSSTHLLAPGTTANKHNLSFQYRNLECPVTREAVPLHYGVTDTSVFDKRTPVSNIDEVIEEIQQWLERSGRFAKSAWPYSIVTKHFNNPWQASLLQPRCDVAVRYKAIRAGGGCCLEIQLCPVVLLCNAAPITLTLRAHDGAPLCKVESGSAIAPPSAILKKPFFISVEMGRETFVSEQLEVSSEEPGRYATPQPGHVVLDHAARFSILCNQKVALLTMYYEIKQEINVLGITTTYMLINRLNTNVLVSAMAVPADGEQGHILRAKTFKVIQPTKKQSIQGNALCHFCLHGRWRGGNTSELNTYILLSLCVTAYPASEPVPIRLGQPPIRRAVSLIDEYNNSVPVVVSQIKHENRWLVVVAYDPCPQFVVHNNTQMPICVAQPVQSMSHDQPTTSQVQVIPECLGIRWHCVIQPQQLIHYSTPAHCTRYPPEQSSGSSVANTAVTMLTFGRGPEESKYDWSAPVAAADGEQLLQFSGGVTIKLRVSTHPHSTLLELKDTDQNDLSASDIRRRLDDMNVTEQIVASTKHPFEANQQAEPWLHRIGGNDHLFGEQNETYPLAEQHSQLSISKGISLTKVESQTITLDGQAPVNENPVETPSKVTSNQISQEDKKLLVEDQPSDVFAEQSETYPLTEKLSQLSIEDTAKQNSVTKEESQSTIAEDQAPAIGNVLEPPSKPTSKEMQHGNEQLLVESKPSTSEQPTKREMRRASIGGVMFIESQKIIDSDWKLHYEKVETSECNVGMSGQAISFNNKLPAGLDESVSPWVETESLRFVMEGMSLEISVSAEVPPLVAVYFDRTAVLVLVNEKKTRTILSVTDIQIDNLQYESGQYDFAVVATTRAEPLQPDRWPPLWNMFAEEETFSTRHKNAKLLLKLTHDKWDVISKTYTELTEVELRIGSLALYVEDAYVTSFVELMRLAWPSAANEDIVAVLSEDSSIQSPLRLRLLHVHPLDLTLTLHTAVRMYIALDQSPLRLSAFKLHDMMTSSDRLTHALTVHYLSAAILGAGWVVGGLELLGAPGALAARLGGATGGVKGVASATAAALLRSLSAWAGSLARNLDLLAGDEEHARRAAAARRRPPPSLVAGLVAGITNFAINILGAVGGLAHHPLVGVAVGETDSSAAALRRGILGALTKPLSATADLVAYAGHGLLRQTGWDPVPEARRSWPSQENIRSAGWLRDCVRWTFRLADMHALAGFRVLLDNATLLLLLTHKFLVVADPESERIVEMIDFKFCSLGSYQGQIIELSVRQRRMTKISDTRNTDEEDEFQISAAAMARVARYTGAEGAATQSEARVLSLLPSPGRSHSLHAALAALIHHNAETHLSML